MFIIYFVFIDPFICSNHFDKFSYYKVNSTIRYLNNCQPHIPLFYSNDLTARLPLNSVISIVGIKELMLHFYFQRFAFNFFKCIILSTTILQYYLTLIGIERFPVLRNASGTCFNVYGTKMWLPTLNSKFFVNKKISNVIQKKTHSAVFSLFTQHLQ